MGYAAFTDPETAYKAALGQDFFRKLKDNFADHESRIVQLLAQSHHCIVEEFLTANAGTDGGIDTNIWDGTGVNATEFFSQVGVDGRHCLRLTTASSSALKAIRAQNTKCAFRLNCDMAGFMEVRVRDTSSGVLDNIVIGLQDRAASTLATDESDLVAFLKGTTANTWRFRVASGGVATTHDNLSSRSVWRTLRLEWLRSGSGAILQVSGFIDGAATGSTITTNIPTGVVVSPTVAFDTPASGNTDVETDRVEVRWFAVPLL